MAKRAPKKAAAEALESKRKPKANDEATPKPDPTEPDLSHISEPLRPLASPLAELVPDAGNARLHDAKNLAAICGSLRQFGQVTPIIARAETKVILAGHGRYAAAQKLYADGDLRWAQIAVVFQKWDAMTGAAYAIADNRTAELAEWDPAALEKQLREVNVGDADLQQMMADLAEAEKLLVLPDDEPDEDVEEPPERHQVLVTLADEEAQIKLLEELEERGFECRALVS